MLRRYCFFLMIGCFLIASPTVTQELIDTGSFTETIAFYGMQWVGDDQLLIQTESSGLLLYSFEDLSEPIQRIPVQDMQKFSVGDDNVTVAIYSLGSDAIQLWNIGDASYMQRIPIGEETRIVNDMLMIGTTLLATIGNNVLVWDWLTGEQIAILEGHQTDVTQLHLTPDRELYTVGGLGPRPSEVWRWDLNTMTGEKLFHTEAPLMTTFSANAEFIVLSQMMWPVIVQPLASYESHPEPFFEFELPNADVGVVYLSPDNHWLLGFGDLDDATFESVGSVSLWWFDTQTQIICGPSILNQLTEESPPTFHIAEAAFSPDSTHLATLWGPEGDATLQIWELTDICEEVE